MLLRRATLAGLALAAAGGCTTEIGVKSNVDQSYGRKLNRVLIVTSMTVMGQETYLKQEEVNDSLRNRFQAAGITVDAVNSTGDIAGATASLRPTQIMLLAVTSILKSGLGSVRSFEMSSEITDVASKKRVWRAKIDFPESQTTGTRFLAAASKEAADKLATLLIAKLRTDGLVP